MKQLFRVLSLASLLGILALNLMSCQASDLSQLQNADENLFAGYSRYTYADWEATAKTDNEIERLAKEPAVTRPAKEPAATRPAKEPAATRPAKDTEVTRPAKDTEVTRPAKEPAVTRPAKDTEVTRPAKEQGSVKTEEITETVIAARPIRKNEEN